MVSALCAWSGAINKITTNWDGKIQLIQAVHQPKGDLMNIAKNDQDPTFRVAATAWLGVAKYNPGSRANEKAINALIANGLKSDDPDIASAAQAANDFTRDELRKLH
jgi:hypothetical protein